MVERRAGEQEMKELLLQLAETVQAFTAATTDTEWHKLKKDWPAKIIENWLIPAVIFTASWFVAFRVMQVQFEQLQKNQVELVDVIDKLKDEVVSLRIKDISHDSDIKEALNRLYRVESQHEQEDRKKQR